MPVAPVGCCDLGATWIALRWGCRLFRNTTELEKLSELGVLFLLFEMGLELSFDRLKVGWHPCLQLLLFRSGLPACSAALRMVLEPVSVRQMVVFSPAYHIIAKACYKALGKPCKLRCQSLHTA